MKKLKIALITYTGSVGGLERVVSNTSYLFENMGFEVHVYLVSSATNFPFAGKLHQFEVDKYNFLNKISKYREIKKSLNEERFDFIFDHRYRLNPLSEFFWQKYIYKNQKVTNYVHNSYINHYLFKNKDLNSLIFGKRRFLCVSKGVGKKVSSKFPELATDVIYNAVRKDKAKESISLNSPYFLAVGRMNEDNAKQFDVLLECFAKSKLPEKNFKLIILGDGKKRKDYEKISRKLNLEKSVEFKGFVNNPQDYMRHAYCTVLTSKYEGLGMVLVESLMVGTPVISFDCDFGPSEIIQHKENGLLVDNQNKTALVEAFNLLVNDHRLYVKLKLNAEKSVEKFSFETIKKEWRKYFLANGTP